jgi:DNA-binding beta-propeller fold protein YncE
MPITMSHVMLHPRSPFPHVAQTGYHGESRRRATWQIIVLGAAIMSTGCSSKSSNDSSVPVIAPASAVLTTPTHQFTFESGPVRPVALSADGSTLYVANTANATLDILSVTSQGLTPVSSVPVGLEPVAVAVRNPQEVWVVNHLSNSVSIVNVGSRPASVAQTLLVGDEPRDIVFAGPSGLRAFITTAHRGQQRSGPALAGVPGAGDPQLTTPGIGRADVWVFDATQTGADTTLGGKPLAIITLFGDKARALAVTPDGKTVYAAALYSGNQTTVLSSFLPCPGVNNTGFGSTTPCTQNGNTAPGSAPGPATNYAGVPAPRVAVIVKKNATGQWLDAAGLDWSGLVQFDLPDQDVFAIDAAALTTQAGFLHVGTTLFNMVVNPKSGNLYVSNTESRNDLRFEGPGTFAGTSLEGHLAESQITVITAAGTVAPRHLNKHIDYSVRPAPASVKQSSLATPLDMVVSADGSTLYVAAFGSSKVGVLPTAALENDSFDPTQLSSGYISVSGGGPSGLALDQTRNRLYVTTRFDSGVSVVDLSTGQETSHLTLNDPDSTTIKQGRHFLYNAQVSSSNGEASCSSCHIFADRDHLAWDLGNPDSDPVVTPVTIKLSLAGPIVGGTPINGTGNIATLHPMKGPMTTQTLRGLAHSGAMHWRGDRVSGFFGTDPATTPPFDEALSFNNFILAFNTLLGLAPNTFATTDMQTFTNFALTLMPRPNPIRNLDNSLTTSQQNGRNYFMGCDGLDTLTQGPAQCGADGRPVGAGHFSDGVPAQNIGFPCEGCHVLDPSQGFFGTNGESSFENLPQTNKVPQLRNVYDKIGMFGDVAIPVVNAGNNGNQGPQVSGFGFTNDGSGDTLFRFLQATVFNSAFNGLVGFAGNSQSTPDQQRADVESFLLAFDSDVAPIVGQQITLDANNASVVGPRIDLLIARAMTPYTSLTLGGQVTECALIATAPVNDRVMTFVLQTNGSFLADTGTVSLTDQALRSMAIAQGIAITYSCLPPGWAPQSGPTGANSAVH